MAVLQSINTKIVGVSKKNEDGTSIQRILKSMAEEDCEGDLLTLTHDPENPYDSNAVMVYHDGDHIGYLSAELAAELAEAVDEDRVEATITELTGGDGLTHGCNILLEILDAPASAYQRRKVDVPQDVLNRARQWVVSRPTVNTVELQRGINIPYSMAEAVMDQLEELGDVGPFQGAKPRPVYVYDTKTVQKPLGQRIFKPLVITCLIVIVLSWGAVFLITSQREKAAKAAADWDRLAISTATVALDQYAPGVNYGPLQTTGWIVLHNSDGTTTVWAPREYGNIYLMMTDDGEAYTPYCISVNNTKVLDLGKP